MRFILAMALLMPLLTLANSSTTLTRTIKGNDAQNLFQLLQLDTDSNGNKTFALPDGAMKLFCNQRESSCDLQLQLKGKSRESSVYLYKDVAAEKLYSALQVREIDGMLGTLKLWVDSEEKIELFCSKSPIASTPSSYSCLISILTE